MGKLIAVLILLLSVSGLALAKDGVLSKKVLPHNYGTVVIDNFSAEAGMAPVVFDHWVHRAKYTCRLCHVDIGFAMRTNETVITAADNSRGYFCGSCHNGRMLFGKNKVFASCSVGSGGDDAQRCARCHFSGSDKEKKKRFRIFAASLPTTRFGNRIDWQKAEEEGLISHIDSLADVSAKAPNLLAQADFSLQGNVVGMPEIIFSHEKHTVWNGCEVCHPDIFLGVKKGATTYSMIELFEGKYCGACHDTVAFPQKDCQRCHTKPVQ